MSVPALANIGAQSGSLGCSVSHIHLSSVSAACSGSSRRVTHLCWLNTSSQEGSCGPGAGLGLCRTSSVCAGKSERGLSHPAALAKIS